MTTSDVRGCGLSLATDAYFHMAMRKLKRRYAALVETADGLRLSIEAAKRYRSTEVEGWRLLRIAELDRPICCCGCGTPLAIRTKGRPPRFAGVACRMRAMRRRSAGLPEATPRLSPGGRADLRSRLRNLGRWRTGRSERQDHPGSSRFQSEMLSPFWKWWEPGMGRVTKPSLPISLGRFTAMYSDRLAREDPVELQRFISISAGRSPRSDRTHLLFIRVGRIGVEAQTGCGRTWMSDTLAMSDDVDSIDCAICRERVILAEAHLKAV